ncbi:MAG: dTDP-4-dehydrorhamnose reductase [Candidatus Baltobacteraceae bacterium]
MNELLRRIVVVGASGQLGSDLIVAFGGLDVKGVDHALVDIERPASVAAMIARERPSLVVNTAAYHNVERCETHADRAFAVNSTAVDTLASLCAATGTALAHISTDYVFDGASRTPYEESAPARPLNVYGISKYAGELAVAARSERHFIFRTSSLYGTRGSSTKGYTFVERIREQARTGRPLRIVDDTTMAPSYTAHVAATIRAVLETGRFGTYHVTNAGSCTWYEFAVEILSASGIAAQVERTTSDAFPSYARRPAYSVLAHAALARAGVALPPHWRDGLRDYLQAKDGASA